ncbi:uncharacterized protein [Coffea arabica]|uniref:Reverse transcriptase domain-containing protein n=1 Tax=Coffea arabica TaxID=13443 RepID=A0ABM4VUE0_COFAR
MVDDTLKAAATSIIHDMVDRVVEEDSQATEDGDDDSEGTDDSLPEEPITAGCLSPRLPRPQGTVPECSHSVTAHLNVDQLSALEQGRRTARGRGIRANFPSDRELRRRLWPVLLRHKPCHEPWYIVGDFNLILSPNEKKGGRPFQPSQGLELSEFMGEAGVLDAGFSRSSFTWCNNRHGRARIWKRLDRDSLLDVVKIAWQGDVSGSPFYRVCTKLKRVSHAIQQWNKETFGDVFLNVKRAEAAVARAELQIEVDSSEENFVELKRVQAELRRVLTVEEQFWKQKSRVKWLQHGDNNSSFFHSVVKQRRYRAAIHSIRDSQGTWITDNGTIGMEAVKFFDDLLSAESSSDFRLVHVIPNLSSEIDNSCLEEAPSFDEVTRVVFSMDDDSAAGPDGFTGKFFTFAWEVVGPDIFQAILSFFCGAELPRFVIATSIVLIPKVLNPQSFSQFRPISVCNFLNKVISRILVSCLTSILPRIISPRQSGFVQGRTLSDNFLLAQELITDIGKKCRGRNVVLKLDMAKAYDRMSWVFIIRVLRRFGFGERFIDMVWRLLSNVWFSVLVNGVSYGFFKSSRGLRQGDPLSPALFIIRAEVLSRGLNLLYSQSNFVGYKVPRHCPTISHLAFADDIIIFANGSASSLKKIMRVLELYQKALGQLVNTSKSGFLLHPSFPMARQGIIERVTKFLRRGFPIRYLGLPLYTGRCKGSYFADLSQQMVDKVLSWKTRLLSSGGKIILIKHVLSSIPIHLLATGVMPKSIFQMIERVCANFLSGTTEESRRFHWVRWRDLCFPPKEGGVGFRSIDDTYRAFSCKLWWTFRQNLSLWPMYMRAKYCHDTYPCQVALRSPISARWRRMLDVRGFVELFILWRPYSGFCHFCRLLSHVLPPDLVQAVVGMPIPCISSVHRMVWTASSFGSFSLSSALQEVRQAKPSSFMFSQHVFMSGDVAKAVWKFFGPLGSLSGLNLAQEHLTVQLANWWYKPTKSKRLKFVFRLLPVFVCWNLWKTRNSTVFEGVIKDVRSIYRSIFQNLKDAYWMKFGELQQVTSWPQFLGLVEQRPDVVKFRLVHWQAPRLSMFKLNIDGCSKGNPGLSGGGGILRDGSGKFIFAFAGCFDVATSLQAEAKALALGLSLCVQRNFLHQ